ncbi:MAG: response regulator transcription factor [Kouleothrix sp.]|jgi:two-component system alkaline phosphatase synthesis response regulator PhoP|nr:response regulator transcription factor [Kouleothrix sp.]
MNQRILVVDDDKQIVRLVQSYLEQAGYAVLTAYDGAAALRAIRTERPDLVVLDLMLPDQDGWSITRTVRADTSQADLPIIMLTARIEDTDKIVGLELGADDYIAKPFNPHELVARVRAVLRRASGAPAQSRVIELGALRIDLDRHAVTRDNQALDVTPTEFDLLKVLMEYPGHAFTRAELIEKGLGYTYDGLDRGIDSHIKNLRKKIEPDPVNPTYIQTVYGVGYRLDAS